LLLFQQRQGKAADTLPAIRFTIYDLGFSIGNRLIQRPAGLDATMAFFRPLIEVALDVRASVRSFEFLSARRTAD
jgi:hypothetical protein